MRHRQKCCRLIPIILLFVLSYFLLPLPHAIRSQTSHCNPVIIVGEGADIGYDLIETEAGQYILTGQTHSFGNGRSDIWLMQVNDRGEVQWNVTFGGIAASYEVILRNDTPF